MILNNAELKRNIWLDFSTHRLLLTPIIVGLIVYLFYLASSLSFAASVAFNLGVFFIFLWGTKNASESVIDEVNQNTWDFQRQSAITPLEMTIGKLLGSTLFSWYGAAISLGLYVILSQQAGNETTNFLEKALPVSKELSKSHEIFLLVCGGLLTQAIALLLSLQVLPSCRRDQNVKSFRYFLLALIIGGQITSKVFLLSKFSNQDINWFHIAMNQQQFFLWSVVIFLGWALVGVFRSFGKELQYPNIPIAWLLFNIFCLIYFSGLVAYEKLDVNNISQLRDIEIAITSLPSYMALFVAVVLTYTALIIDNLTILQYKRLKIGLGESRPIESLSHVPLWFISFACLTVMSLICLTRPIPKPEFIDNFASWVLVLTVLLFVLRDIGLMHYFSFKQKRRILSTFVLYLFILYIITPWILGFTQAKSLIPAFVPSYGEHREIAFVSLAIQISVLVLLVKKQITKQLNLK